MDALTSIVGVRVLYLIWDAPFCSHGQVWELSSAKSGKTHVDPHSPDEPVWPKN
jgi:hypothetical protein